MAEIFKHTTKKEELVLISKIAKRALENMEDTHGDLLSLTMDIQAVHENDFPLRLQELHDAGEFDFFHDVFGIVIHLDRDTGKLKDCFVPRYAR